MVQCLAQPQHRLRRRRTSDVAADAYLPGTSPTAPVAGTTTRIRTGSPGPQHWLNKFLPVGEGRRGAESSSGSVSGRRTEPRDGRACCSPAQAAGWLQMNTRTDGAANTFVQNGADVPPKRMSHRLWDIWIERRPSPGEAAHVLQVGPRLTRYVGNSARRSSASLPMTPLPHGHG